ncbi:MAG: hypothetical protein M9916_00435 [Crocinitomicaceae bacterium]|nr:hypothetical protein [Crocinitomicaceae bacterium]
MQLRRKIKTYTDAPLNHQMVSDVLSEYERPNDKISELIKEGQLVALRRGLYIPGDIMDLQAPGLFVIANHLRGPSYVSLESALSHWGMIPERVREISSITLKATKTYTTPIGRFSYRYVAAPYYSFGLERLMITSRQVAMIASREKALCDKIIFTPGVHLRSKSQTLDFLIEDMRIDEHYLSNLNTSMIQSWIEDAPKKSSLQMLIKTLRSL